MRPIFAVLPFLANATTAAAGTCQDLNTLKLPAVTIATAADVPAPRAKCASQPTAKVKGVILTPISRSD